MINKIKTILKNRLLNNFPKIYKRLFYASLSRLNAVNIKSQKRESEMLILKQILPAYRPAIDIGANYGDYTFLMEKLIPPELIFAFEPIPELNKRLQKVFPRVNIIESAVSNSNGYAAFKIPEVNEKVLFSRSTLQTNLEEKNETGKSFITVNTVTLDSFVQKYNIGDVGFIKIDVEGNELNVIKGGLDTIKKFKPNLLIEIEQRHHDESINEIIGFIKTLGYHCFYLNVEFKIIELLGDAIELQASKENYINNFIFIA